LLNEEWNHLNARQLPSHFVTPLRTSIDHLSTPERTTSTKETLILQGCQSSSAHQYQIDLGQQYFESGTIHWSIKLRYPKSRAELSSSTDESATDESLQPIGYRVYSVMESDEEWLSFSNKGGQLQPGAKRSIKLSFRTDCRPDSFLTFVVIENLSEPKDLKVIKVKMEVVSSSKLKFYIHAGHYGLQKNDHKQYLLSSSMETLPTIDLGDVYCGNLYFNRFFVISNQSDRPLEFVFSSNIIAAHEGELNFSLSRNTLTLCNSVTVLARGSTKVYLHFRPMRSSASVNDKQWSERKVIEIYVSCRLVKSHQEVIYLKATYRAPQLRCSQLGVTFKGNIYRTPANLENNTQMLSKLDTLNNTSSGYMGSRASPSVFLSGRNDVQPGDYHHHSSGTKIVNNAWMQRDQQHLVIEQVNDNTFIVLPNHYASIQLFNLFESPLHYSIRSCSEFFSIEKVPQSVIESRLVSQFVHIKPNIAAIAKYKRQFLSRKYIEEHITVYNRHRLTERLWITLRLTLGDHAFFRIADTGSIIKSPFHTLEESIGSFLGEFNYFWDRTIALTMLATSQTTLTTSSHLSELTKQFGRMKHHSARKDQLILSTIQRIQAQRMDDQLYFELVFINDELIYHLFNKGAGYLPISLANLLYGGMLQHDIFSFLPSQTTPKMQEWLSTSLGLEIAKCLLKWLAPIDTFLSYFPSTHSGLEQLLGYRERFWRVKAFIQQTKISKQ